MWIFSQGYGILEVMENPFSNSHPLVRVSSHVEKNRDMDFPFILLYTSSKFRVEKPYVLRMKRSASLRRCYLIPA